MLHMLIPAVKSVWSKEITNIIDFKKYFYYFLKNIKFNNKYNLKPFASKDKEGILK